MTLFLRRLIILTALCLSSSISHFAADTVGAAFTIRQFRITIPGVLTNLVDGASADYRPGSMVLERLDPANGSYSKLSVKEMLLTFPVTSDALKQWVLDARKGTAAKKRVTVEAFSAQDNALVFTVQYVGTLPTSYSLRMPPNDGLRETVSLTFEQILYDTEP